MKVAAVVAPLVLVLGLVPAPATAETSIAPIAYTLVAPQSQSPSGLITRAVLAAGTPCPSLVTFDAVTKTPTSTPMAVRPTPANTGTAYTSVVVCEVAVPQGVLGKGVVDTGTSVKPEVPTALEAVDTMAILGDTGCRIFVSVQECNNTQKWPLAAISAAIASHAPDLIVHVGDYFYRNWSCPAGDANKCGGSPPAPKKEPFRATAAGFITDALTPMTPMFSVAPIVAMRGNHEACNAAGNAYFLFMDPHFGTENTCSPKKKGKKWKAPVALQQFWGFSVPLSNGGTLRAPVVDSSYGWDNTISRWAKKMRPNYQQAQNFASQGNPSDAWLLTHRPVFGVTNVKASNKFGKSNTQWVSQDQTAGSQGTLAPYGAILSGHMHLAQAVQIPNQPGQLIIGNSGTSLDPKRGYPNPKFGPLATGKGKPENRDYKPYPKASSLWTKVAFGYAIATPSPTPGNWSIVIEGVTDTLANCTLTSKTIACTTA